MRAATASIASQVADPYCGQTKVVETTGGAYCATQPEPGHVIHDGQASVPPVMMLMLPLIARAAARFPDQASVLLDAVPPPPNCCHYC